VNEKDMCRSQIHNSKLNLVNGIFIALERNQLIFNYINLHDDKYIIAIHKIPPQMEKYLKIGRKVFLKEPINRQGYVRDITKANDSKIESDTTYQISIVDELNQTYECYGNEILSTKEACEDRFIHGRIRKPDEFTVWDKRCNEHHECPFFEKSVDGYQGDCVNGFCKMPVGIKTSSYTKYLLNNESYPFCNDCNDHLTREQMEDCCEQKRIEKEKNTLNGKFIGNMYTF
jgi:hypothetical protein